MVDTTSTASTSSRARARAPSGAAERQVRGACQRTLGTNHAEVTHAFHLLREVERVGRTRQPMFRTGSGQCFDAEQRSIQAGKQDRPFGRCGRDTELPMPSTYRALAIAVIHPDEGGNMLHLCTKLQARLTREEGQTMAEYAVVLAVIAIGIFVALGVLSGAISGALSSVSSNI
jgi:Flp pilus assembly pilin Flp